MSYDIRIKRQDGKTVELRNLVKLTDMALADYPNDEMFWDGD